VEHLCEVIQGRALLRQRVMCVCEFVVYLVFRRNGELAREG
jgi:hypothetical protein